MDLSVIIVSYNVRYYLRQCLESVNVASEGLKTEILVIDNCSSDGSVAMVNELFPGVRLIENNSNNGFSAACNQGINLSTGEYVLLLNPDTFIARETFIRCIAFMRTRPEAGAVGVKLINGNGRLLPESKRALPTPSTAFFKMSGLGWIFPRSGIFNRYYLGHLGNSETTEAEVLTGAFMFINRKVLEKTGLLDEDFFMYGEDIDLSYRIIKAGYKNYYFPGVSIIHYKGESTKKNDLKYLVHFYRAMIIFAGKHFSKGRNKTFLFPLRVAITIIGTVAIMKNLVKRLMISFIQVLEKVNPFRKTKGILVLGNPGDIEKIKDIILSGKSRVNISEIRYSEIAVPEKDKQSSPGLLSGTVRSHRIDEVIFSSAGISAGQIIEFMEVLSAPGLYLKIAHPEQDIIIGSNSVTLHGNHR